MEPVSITIISYVALKFIDQFLKEEGYGRFKKWFFPETKYKNQLTKVIYSTIEEYNSLYPDKIRGDKFPFFHSQVLFEELNKYLLFKEKQPKNNYLIEKFKENPRIKVPTTEELNSFYTLFSSKVKADKKLKSIFINENYKSKIHEIAESLNTIENKIDKVGLNVAIIQSVLTFNPDDNWFRNHCKQSIVDLGKRYTPELNFELEITKIFEGLGRTYDFKNLITKQYDDLLIKGKKILSKNEETKEQIQLLEKQLDSLFKICSQIDYDGSLEINFEEIESNLLSIEKLIREIENYYVNEERKIQEEKKDYKFYHKYGYELRHIREFESSIYSFKSFINSAICKLVNNPYLVLDGEAGIGKSHMFGDIVSKRIENNYESIFLLGQHFTSDESPWVQIFKKLQINSSSKDFLKTLDDRARDRQKKIIIFIDAINEGRGKYFWNDNIKSFIHEIKEYKHLGLALSIRSSYKNLIFPKDEIKALDVIEHRLYGFRSNEYEASKLFFTNYNIQLPNVPLLHPEFQNPLFLKLFCEGIYKSGQNKIPEGIQGITSIIDFFVKNVNEVLATPKRFEYSNGLNLVDKSISAIIQYKIDNDIKYVAYEKAIELIEDTVSKYISKKGTFLDELISEGIFSKNLFWKQKGEYEEGIYLAYERFEDHLFCKYLLTKYPDSELEFKDGGNLFKYVKEENDLYYNQGLIDAFSIQIPEKTEKEFYEFVPHLKDNYSIIESFVESLLWRKMNTIDERSRDYVNNFVFNYEGTSNLFWETILSVSSIPEHYFNAYSLHEHLMSFSMADRDAQWTEILKYKYDDDSAVKRLIDWAWNETDRDYISDESIKLAGITLAWFHTSTNRQLRDCATKALVSLLQNRLHVLLEILKMFEKVNDPSVYERLFAVAYGCALRTNQKEILKELSEYIFETIFNKDGEIYPHALLRDYARGVIEYTLYLEPNLHINVDKIRPPYESDFEEEFPTDEAIDNEFDPKEEGYWGKEKWGNTAILMSMGVEHGRHSYGDFGRYTFQSALRSWNVSSNALSNLAIKWIFEKYGYDPKKHGDFDSEIGSGRGRDSIPNERIGKKYQWLALYEMIARVSDNFKKHEEWGSDSDKEEEYQGPWSPYIRDIDPTILIKDTASFDEDIVSDFWWSSKNEFNWDYSNSDWVKTNDDLPSGENMICVVDNDNEEWLVLEGYPEWAEPKKIGEEKWNYAHKRLWFQIRSYIVKEEEFDNFQHWSEKQDFMGRWMPESRDRYEIFNREYYWSPAYEYFRTEYYGGEQERYVNDKKTGEFITSVIVPVENYRWEEEFDKSKENTISFLKPSIQLFNGMKLQYSDREGVFADVKNELVCFDTNVYHDNSRSFFLIRKNAFLEYLSENKLKVLWTVLGEKQIIGGRTFREDYVGMLEISGSYFISSENRIIGDLKTKLC
ncbi:AVAST type 2 anti-phage system protein Avs2 [Chryseobacterium sp. RLHN22]|uniref:AVAST type 2 anti-phage system protein Avs2 n=1 Tax=Chryseobacterium sp. RLHN22 TaxID=3437885 RepID=UPI003D9AF1D1